MKKKRSDSVLDGLPQNQRGQIEGWLFEENLSYKDTQARCLADLNVRISSSGLHSFYDSVAERRMLDRIASSRSQANSVAAQFKKNPANTSEALINLVTQAAFDSAMSGENINPKLVYLFTDLALKAKKQELADKSLELDSRRVVLLEKKAAAYDRAQAALNDAKNSKGGLTKETLTRIERELNLM